MSKRFNPNRVKIHRNYTIKEISSLFSVHDRTPRNWIKDGLPISDNKKPILVLGPDLKEFLQKKRLKHKQKCRPHEIYCVRCRQPKFPNEGRAEYEPISSSTGRLIAICPDCHGIMNKYISSMALEIIQEKLDVTIRKQGGGGSPPA